MGCCTSRDNEETTMSERMTVFFEHELPIDDENGAPIDTGDGGQDLQQKRQSYANFAQCHPRHKLCDVASVACRSCIKMEDVEFYTIKSSCESGQVKIMAGPGSDAELKSMGMFKDKTAFPMLCFRVHMKQ